MILVDLEVVQGQESRAHTPGEFSCVAPLGLWTPCERELLCVSPLPRPLEQPRVPGLFQLAAKGASVHGPLYAIPALRPIHAPITSSPGVQETPFSVHRAESRGWI